MKNLLALGIILGLAACGGDEGEMDDFETDMEFEQPAPMPGDTMGMDTMGMDTMMHDTMDMGPDTMGTGM